MGKDLTAEGIAAEKKRMAVEAFDRLHKAGGERFGMEWLQAHMAVSGVIDEEYVSEDGWGNASMEVKAAIADTVFRLLERYQLVPRSISAENGERANGSVSTAKRLHLRPTDEIEAEVKALGSSSAYAVEHVRDGTLKRNSDATSVWIDLYLWRDEGEYAYGFDAWCEMVTKRAAMKEGR